MHGVCMSVPLQELFQLLLASPHWATQHAAFDSLHQLLRHTNLKNNLVSLLPAGMKSSPTEAKPEAISIVRAYVAKKTDSQVGHWQWSCTTTTCGVDCKQNHIRICTSFEIWCAENAAAGLSPGVSESTWHSSAHRDHFINFNHMLAAPVVLLSRLKPPSLSTTPAWQQSTSSACQLMQQPKAALACLAWDAWIPTYKSCSACWQHVTCQLGPVG